MQIRANCESAAFYRCGHLELSKANEKLDRLISLQHRLICRQYALQCKYTQNTGSCIDDGETVINATKCSTGRLEYATAEVH
jgi:hypothetical protein